jgi:electron transfer flavoprotein alpha subunit
MPADIGVLAVVVVRDGQPPAGADETVAEAGGFALVVGSGTHEAAERLPASRVWLLEQSCVAPGALASGLAHVLAGVDMVLLPASPDGRDLAPRLAVVLGRGLLAGAVRCTRDEVELTRLDDRVSLRVAVDEPVVVTLRPGSRGRPEPVALAEVTALPLCAPSAWPDAESIDVLQPEPSTVDLAEAHRILSGGAGLVPAGADGRGVMRLLADVAGALEASAGATRVVTDAGWMSYDRQIAPAWPSTRSSTWPSVSLAPHNTSAVSARRRMW